MNTLTCRCAAPTTVLIWCPGDLMHRSHIIETIVHDLRTCPMVLARSWRWN